MSEHNGFRLCCVVGEGRSLKCKGDMHLVQQLSGTGRNIEYE